MTDRPKLSRRTLLGAAGGAILLAGGTLAVQGAGRRRLEDGVLPWMKANAHPFDPAQPESLWSPEMARALAGARIVGLGEATHGSHEDSVAKAAIFKSLVTSGAAGVLYLEVNAEGGRQLDAFIRGGEGDPRARLRSAKVFTVFKSRALADLLGWLRDWNRTAKTPVRIFGIDCQSTAQDAASAIAALRTLDLAEAERLEAPLAPILSHGAQGLRFPALIKSLTTEQLHKAMAALETLEQALARHDGQADAQYAARTAWQGLKAFEMETGDGKITGDKAEYFGRRDAFMAENILKAPAASGGAFWAHNTHVAGGSPPGSGFVPAGGRLRRALGQGYRAVVFEYGEARFNAVPALPVGPPPSASSPKSVLHWTGKHGRLAELLARSHGGSFWIPLRDLPDDAPGRAWRKLPYKLQWPGYAATRLQALDMDPKMACGSMFDVVVYIAALSPSQAV